MPIGARRCEAWVVIPKCPFVVKSGWCCFVSHDVIVNVDVQFGLLTVQVIRACRLYLLD